MINLPFRDVRVQVFGGHHSPVDTMLFDVGMTAESRSELCPRSTRVREPVLKSRRDYQFRVWCEPRS
jgi:hypothetical protein